jgi:hypothetical protein
VEDRDDTRTIRARVTGQVLTLDAALQETLPALLVLLDVLPEDDPSHVQGGVVHGGAFCSVAAA